MQSASWANRFTYGGSYNETPERGVKTPLSKGFIVSSTKSVMSLPPLRF